MHLMKLIFLALSWCSNDL